MFYFISGLTGLVLHFSLFYDDPMGTGTSRVMRKKHPIKAKVGNLRALQASSKGYVLGDFCYLIDSLFVCRAWWLQLRISTEMNKNCVGSLNAEEVKQGYTSKDSRQDCKDETP